MDPLHYTSEEMYSSTELIRKSKKIFDRLNKKEIEKAIILRDGKPGFMLLEFSEYEKMMKDYLRLKQMNTNSNKKINEEIKVTKDEKQTKIEQQKVELSEMDLEAALKEIENLNIGEESSISIKDSSITEKTIEQKEALKEFWE
ncbi:hypothetical protein [Arcobacter arenosus]|uniref:hypothetical protein n=1 Tax=Arcobacter arenosus TaxID=2576037 RepID=UPI00148533C5|nr:hypothetical protein [Arcobacter arenosus]